jgi:hypothetical protein
VIFYKQQGKSRTPELYVAVSRKAIPHTLDDALPEWPPTHVFHPDIGPNSEQLPEALIGGLDTQSAVIHQLT